MADLSYLNPRVMWHETKRSADMPDEAAPLPAAEAQRQSAIGQVRERARRHLVGAGTLLAVGAAAFAMAVVAAESDEAPDWAIGLSLGAYAAATGVGSVKYLASADNIIYLRELQSAAANEPVTPPLSGQVPPIADQE